MQIGLIYGLQIRANVCHFILFLLLSPPKTTFFAFKYTHSHLVFLKKYLRAIQCERMRLYAIADDGYITNANFLRSNTHAVDRVGFLLFTN